MLYAENIRRAFLFFSILFFVCAFTLPAVAQERQSPSTSVQQDAKGYIHVEMSKEPICDEIYSFLLLPENEKYLGFGRPTFYPNNLFYIPPDNKNFSQVTWQESSEDDFKKYLPKEYEDILWGINHGVGIELRSIQKIRLDVYNRKVENTIFRVDNGVFQEIYLYEEDPVRRGFKRMFDDNASFYIPFKYHGEVIFSGLKSGQYLNILRYGKNKESAIPSRMLCMFRYQKVKMEK